MAALFIIAAFAVLLLLGTPIGTAVGVAGAGALLLFDLGFSGTGTNFVAGIASFPLLAIPFFVLAGVIMRRAGLAGRIAELLEKSVGSLPGGLAIVAVGTCMFWGALSGSGPATTAAVGMVLLAPMIRHGYDRNFAAATIANAADLSIIIPPSIAFIIYGNLTGVSVSALFMAGVLPGVLCGAAIGGLAWWISWRRGYRGAERRGGMPEIWRALRSSFWALLAPLIILGGIYLSVFTPTEAAVVAVFYSLFISMLVYRTVGFRDLAPMLAEAAVTSSVIMFIVVFAGIFSLAASTTGVIDAAAQFIIRISPNALTTVLLINALLLILGMFLDAISISYLVVPILLPVFKAYGLDPLWYGVVFTVALAIGQITPPVGVNLATVAELADTDMDAVSKQLLPYIGVNVVVLILLSLWPALALFLPKLTGLYTP